MQEKVRVKFADDVFNSDVIVPARQTDDGVAQVSLQTCGRHDDSKHDIDIFWRSFTLCVNRNLRHAKDVVPKLIKMS